MLYNKRKIINKNKQFRIFCNVLMGTKINYPPEIPFKIDNMKLDITLEFNEDKLFLVRN